MDNDAGQHEFSLSEDLVQSPQHKIATTRSFDFSKLIDPPLRVYEDLSNGNGGQAWPAGMILARYLLSKHRNQLRHANSVLELGAGGGLVGLAIAMGCNPTAVVHITDQESMLALMQRNIALNQLHDMVKASVYNWGGTPPEDIPIPADVVLAADCVYFEPAFPLLLQTLHDLIGPKTVCYFCFKRRRRADMQFLKAAKKAFAVDVITDDPFAEEYARENIFLWTIRKKT